MITSKTPKLDLHGEIVSMVEALVNTFIHDNKIIKVLEARVVEDCGACGEFLKVTKEGILVGCGKDCLLLLRVKPEGKGEMSARDWYNGLKR